MTPEAYAGLALVVVVSAVVLVRQAIDGLRAWRADHYNAREQRIIDNLKPLSNDWLADHAALVAKDAARRARG